MPNSTVTGESISINDSAEMRLLNLEIKGNSKQEGEPTPESAIEIKSCGNNGNIKIKIENNDKSKCQNYIIPTQQPMRGVGEYKDTFIKKEGVWFERHLIKSVILNGTENWELYTSGTRRYGLQLSNKLPLKIENKYGNGYCNYFKIQKEQKNDLTMFLQVEENHFYIGIIDIISKWNSKADLKTWLTTQYNAGIPVNVNYILEIPEDIECTEEQKEILNKIEDEAKTYKGVTHIYSIDEVSPNIQVTFLKDIEMMIGGI